MLSLDPSQHLNLRGKHSFLSPSKYHWLQYDDDKLKRSYLNHLKASEGTKLHDIAEKLITMKIRLPHTTASLNSFVNDAIGWRMYPEYVLYYSENCFGTVDALGYEETEKTLRIHDLKTGVSPASMKQVDVYTALFFLTHPVKPEDTMVEQRIYQNDEILFATPTVEYIHEIMDIIRKHNLIIESMKSAGGYNA